MLVQLPEPYPDELLYSVIARYLRNINAFRAGGVTARLFGRAGPPGVDLPGYLQRVADATGLVWNRDADEIAMTLTLYPFYARYAPPDRAKKSLRILKSNRNSGATPTLGISISTVRMPRFLRFCRQCREEDLARHGETYWHRSHQLGGVLVCPLHGTLLRDSRARFRPQRYGDYLDATSSTASQIAPPRNDLRSAEMRKTWLIAKRCSEFLLDEGEWRRENIATQYRRAVLERGFVDGTVYLAPQRLEEAFRAFYGDKLLALMGCSLESGTREKWLNKLLRPSDRNHHPVRHALIQVFLENLPVTKPIPFGLGPWKCPNRFVKHAERYPIKKAVIRHRDLMDKSRRELIATGTCPCGIKFLFMETDPKDPTMPIVHRYLLLERHWLAEARRLRRESKTFSEIMQKMGVKNRGYMRRVFALGSNQRPRKQPPKRNQIRMWRREWRALLASLPNRKRTTAVKANHALYWKLYRHDNEWLKSTGMSRHRYLGGRPRIDWSARDREWSAALRAAAEKLRDSPKIRWLTSTSIIIEAGLSVSIYMRLSQLPLCQAVLAIYKETIEESHERRLKAAAQQLQAESRPTSRSALCRKAGLHLFMLPPTTLAVVDSLLNELAAG